MAPIEFPSDHSPNDGAWSFRLRRSQVRSLRSTDVFLGRQTPCMLFLRQACCQQNYHSATSQHQVSSSISLYLPISFTSPFDFDLDYTSLEHCESFA